MRYQLSGGSYVSRSVIANAQRCINYYPEINRDDGPVPFTYYQRPGFRPLVKTDVSAPVRMLYQASNGTGYTVIGNTVYVIQPNWNLVQIGQIGTNNSTPCRAIDNGLQMMLVDGSETGYKIVLANNAFSTIVDTTGTFKGANTVAYLDSYIQWNMPGTNFFGSTLSNGIDFNALYFAAKTGYPDNLVAVAEARHELLLLGRLKSEIWYNAGNADFPFAILPGAYIEHGCAATYSVSSQDIETYWLGRDLQGQGVVFALRGYDTRRISNHALEVAIQNMDRIDDAIGYTYQQQGHVFYVLTFPSADQTWVYDASLGKSPEHAWHQRVWVDGDGDFHRDRSNCAAFINGTNVVGDWENGTIYALDLNYYKDTVLGVDYPMVCVKGFPHVFQASTINAPMQQTLSTEFKRVQFTEFIADIDCGDVPLDTAGNPATIGLRTSHTRGKSWAETVLQTAGNPGQYETVPSWKQIGIARDIVFELEHNINGPAALNGAWVKSIILDT